MQYVLASASPRRKELFSQLADGFEIIPSDFDEEGISRKLAPKSLVKALAEGKAKAVATRPENEGKTIVALLPDTGDRYLSTPLFAE